MMNKSESVRLATVGALALTLCVTILSASAADVVRLTNGKTIPAKDVQWQEEKLAYSVTTPDGVTMVIAKAQVESLAIAKPSQFGQAESMVAAKQYAAAIPLLSDIIVKYKMKVWDNEARKLLAQARMAMNDPKQAAAALESYMASVPKAEIPADTIMLYWRALQAAGRGAALKKELDDVVATGSRPMAAAAMVMRGNMNREAGQKEAAVQDYLRVVILFENVKTIQPEALFRAGEILDEMRDPMATELKDRLVQEYKDSEYAAKLSEKI